MKCKTCQGDVPPKFTHALLVNACPLCGGAIMEEQLQKALKDLKSAMQATDKYKDEILDWLKSNFSLVTEDEMTVKLQEAEESFKKTHRPSQSMMHQTAPNDVQLDENGNQISGAPVQSAEVTNKFFRNAEVKGTLQRKDHFKNMVNKIKNGEVPAEDIATGIVTPEMLMNSDAPPLDDEELEMLRHSGGDLDELNSGLDQDSDDEIPAVVLNMANKAGNSGKDFQALQKLMGKSSSVSRAMASGGVGKIRR